MQCTDVKEWPWTLLLCVSEPANLASLSDDFARGALMLSWVYTLLTCAQTQKLKAHSS